LIRTGLLGGSFNPAHEGHRRITLAAIAALGLDEVWWLVSPGNPLKPAAGMAPLPARLAAARRAARRAPIRVTAIEARLGTRYTVDTISTLIARYPRRRFIWLMGADNLQQFDQWRDWRSIARKVPIAVIGRPGYDSAARRSPAMSWLRRFVRPARHTANWTGWRLPALVQLRFRPDPNSSTAWRGRDPDWYVHVPTQALRDSLTRRPVT
jgi:nicotinate-nucleotide adenylyltransferase